MPKLSDLIWAKARRGMDCSDCGEPMTGIHSYAARTTCYHCGGKARLAEANARYLARLKQARR